MDICPDSLELPLLGTAAHELLLAATGTFVLVHVALAILFARTTMTRGFRRGWGFRESQNLVGQASVSTAEWPGGAGRPLLVTHLIPESLIFVIYSAIAIEILGMM